ncbi:hypothetical protein D3C73_1103680 [compost metagenome]
MWIREQEMFDADELRELLAELLDERHLFYGIGHVEDSSVFTRTFSVLVVVLIVQRHVKEPFLGAEEFRNLKVSLLRYYRDENDLRGYVEEGGWAHAAAHGADALNELVKCPESGVQVQLEVLEAIEDMLQNRMWLFSEEEDERLATIVDTMITEERLGEAAVTSWLTGLSECIDWTQDRRQRIASVNCKNFLRCLYFRRSREKRSGGILTALLAAEAALNKFVR